MNQTIIAIKDGEYWWAGVIDLSCEMPFSKDTTIRFDMLRDPFIREGDDACCNQMNPLFLSSLGRYAYMPKLGAFSIENGMLTLTSEGEIFIGEASSLKQAYLQACNRFFPPSGQMPDPLCFTAPQYCTWMELLYGQDQASILQYAKAIVGQGLPVGEFIIDDGWEEYYGHWDFDKRKFPDPKAMCDELRALGFKVVLWIVPYVSPDSDAYRELKAKGLLLLNEHGKPFITEWWNGFSAVLDFSQEKAKEWFIEKYRFLMETYGIEGLKMDGGDPLYYPQYRSGKGKLLAHEHTQLYASLDLGGDIKELRACVKNAGQPIVQRVADRQHSWKRKRGLSGIVERMLLQGLSGYAYTCPDMVGGGLIDDYHNGVAFHEELYCRYAELSALLPSLQMSKFFWKHSEKLTQSIHGMVKLHQKAAPYIVELARHSAKTGEPIVRSIAYEYGERPDITDQFLLGDKYLVAPVMQQGATQRKVYLPKGRWQNGEGQQIYDGGQEITVDAPIGRLPYFVRVEG